MPDFYDTHAHLDNPRFANDLDAVVQNAIASGITRIVCVGTTLDTSRRALELSPDHVQSFIQYGTIGYALAQTRRFAEAIPALNEAIRRAPPTDARVTTYYVYRSLSRFETGDKAGARADAQEAERRGARLDPGYMRRLAG